MVDWKRLFIGKQPTSLGVALKQLRYWKFVYYVCLFAFVVVWFGTQSVESELNVCWGELDGYRVVNQSSVYVDTVGGFSCDLVNDSFVCNNESLGLG